MPINLKPSSDFTPFLKFNGKAGRFYTKDEAGQEVEVDHLEAAFDLQNIKIGWLLFAEGQAPDHVWDAGGTVPPRPSDKHKRGFSINVFSPKCLGGLREFSGCSNAAVAAIRELYDAYEAAPEHRDGLVPVVVCERVTPVKSKFGTNYQPVLRITRWIPRPAALPGAEPQRPAPALPPGGDFDGLGDPPWSAEAVAAD